MKKSLHIAAAAIAVGALSLAQVAPAFATVAYVSENENTARVRNADGTNDQVLATFADARIGLVRLSRDGSRALLVVGPSEGQDSQKSYIVNTANGSVITVLDTYATDISPDGTKLLVQNYDYAQNVNMYQEVDIATGHFSDIPNLQGRLALRGYTPDGTQVVYKDIANNQIMLHTLASGTSSVLVAAGTSGTPTAVPTVDEVSYSGSVVYTLSTGECNDPVTIHTINIDGSGNANYSNNTDFGIVISPDGTQALLIRGATPRVFTCFGQTEVYELTLASANGAGGTATGIRTTGSYDWANGTVAAMASAVTPIYAYSAAPAPSPAGSDDQATLAATGVNYTLIALLSLALVAGAGSLAYKAFRR